jgi:hypothetical protein
MIRHRPAFDQDRGKKFQLAVSALDPQTAGVQEIFKRHRDRRHLPMVFGVKMLGIVAKEQRHDPGHGFTKRDRYNGQRVTHNLPFG